MPAEMSGGQQQRAAVARAIITNPALILADEPTGNLDSASSADVMRVFDQLNAAGRTIVLITHEHEIAAHARRVIHISDGQIDADEPQAAVVA
jgi:putative ABC transport system ATP-binding protein